MCKMWMHQNWRTPALFRTSLIVSRWCSDTIFSREDSQHIGYREAVQNPNQSAVTVKGAHFLAEDSPEEVGSATASFVAKVLAGQIR
jgi:hypothetical protein